MAVQPCGTLHEVESDGKCSSRSARTVQRKEIGAEWMVQFHDGCCARLRSCDKGASRRDSTHVAVPHGRSIRTQIHMVA